MAGIGESHARGVFPCKRQLPLMMLILAALSTLFIAACSTQTTTSIATTPTGTTQQAMSAVTIRAVDFSFMQPQTVPAGFVDLIFINNGTQPHQIQLARINNGNYNQFAAALKKNGPGAALGLAALYGGANTIDPGQQQEVILNLPQGQYASICFVSGQDNVPHYMKGMLTHFSVTGSPAGTQQAPTAIAHIVLKDFTFVLPATIPAGQATLQVTNQGPQAHEFDLLKLATGKSLQDAQTFLNNSHPGGPPPFTDAGGMGALAPGSSAWLKLNLQPGNYVAICFVPDVKTGKPHYMLGMMSPFTVA
jgi:hypothetical protein